MEICSGITQEYKQVGTLSNVLTVHDFQGRIMLLQTLELQVSHRLASVMRGCAGVGSLTEECCERMERDGGSR